MPYVDMPNLHFFFLTQPLAISNQASASGILAISPGHGTHTLAALVPQLLWNIGSAGRELLVKSWQIWLRFFRTGSSQLLLGSCTCWPEAQGVPVPTALRGCMFPVTKKRPPQGGGGGTLQSKVGPWYLEVGGRGDLGPWGSLGRCVCGGDLEPQQAAERASVLQATDRR